MTQPPLPAATTPIIQAWIYPGDPACSAAAELADGRAIAVLKPQYFALQDTGVLSQIPNGSQCNGYSAANLAAIKAHSQQQFVTISGSIRGVAAMARQPILAASFTASLLAFLDSSHMSGVELDIEDFGSWSPYQYGAYKNVIRQMGETLHTHGYQIMIDGPAIINATYQGYYPFKYEDMDKLPIDQIVVMCYDFQYDNGGGTPVASLADVTGCCQWMKARISDPARIVIGLNSYGYHTKMGAYDAIRDTYTQSTQYAGFQTAHRDPASGELMWTVGDEVYDYSDSQTLDGKLRAVLDTGLSHISVWHLGGANPWFSPSAPVSATSSAPDVLGNPLLAVFQNAYPGFEGWYAAHFDGEGGYHA